jgi:hypothetical protein
MGRFASSGSGRDGCDQITIVILTLSFPKGKDLLCESNKNCHPEQSEGPAVCQQPRKKDSNWLKRKTNAFWVIHNSLLNRKCNLPICKPSLSSSLNRQIRSGTLIIAVMPASMGGTSVMKPGETASRERAVIPRIPVG